MPATRQHPYDTYSSPVEIYSPWEIDEGFLEYFSLTAGSLVTRDRIWILYSALQQCRNLPGCWYECGVYKGGTATMLARLAAEAGRHLHLFDTFEGMPETDSRVDRHKKGDFSDTSKEAVAQRLAPWGNSVILHPGFIPETFAGRETDHISFAHIDVDIYQSVKDCCAFIYERLLPSGIMIFDDYGFNACWGAKVAVDEFFGQRPEFPFVLPTGQALVTKIVP